MYDNDRKQLAWTTWWEGYQQGYGVEDMKAIDKRAARERFERWWKRNE